MNIKKTQVMFLGRKGRKREVENASINHQGVTLMAEPNIKFLGVTVDRDLNWSEHVIRIRRKCLASLVQLRHVFPVLPRRMRIMIYNVLVLPHLDYCSCVWSACGTNLQVKLERIQNYAMRMITSAKPRTPSAQLRAELSWMPLQDRRKMQIVTKVHSCLHGEAPEYLCSKFRKTPYAELRETRGADNLRLLYPHTSLFQRCAPLTSNGFL